MTTTPRRLVAISTETGSEKTYEVRPSPAVGTSLPLRKVWSWWPLGWHLKPDGWEDYGPVQDAINFQDGKFLHAFAVHPACRSRVHTGQVLKYLVQWCPQCRVVTGVASEPLGDLPC